MKTLACLLALGSALAAQTCRGDQQQISSLNRYYKLGTVSAFDVEIGLTGELGTMFVVVYGGPRADAGKLVVERSGSIFTEDVDGDGFADLVLLGAVVDPVDVDEDGFDEIVVSADAGKPRANNVVFVMTVNP